MRKQNELMENSDKKQLATPTITTPKIHYEVKGQNQSDQYNRIKWHLLVINYVYLILNHWSLYASFCNYFFFFNSRWRFQKETKWRGTWFLFALSWSSSYYLPPLQDMSAQRIFQLRSTRSLRRWNNGNFSKTYLQI